MAKAKRFKCSKCDRKFSMAAHLARHMKTIHGGKRAGAKKRVGRPKGARTGVLTPALAILGGQTSRLLGDLQDFHGQLTAQRQALDAQLDAVGQAIAAFGAAVPKRPAKRGRPAGRAAKGTGRPGSLKDYIYRALRQSAKPLSPRAMGVAVVKAGFKTKSKDITKAVSNTLPKMPGIKKLGFGEYRLAGG